MLLRLAVFILESSSLLLHIFCGLLLFLLSCWFCWLNSCFCLLFFFCLSGLILTIFCGLFRILRRLFSCLRHLCLGLLRRRFRNWLRGYRWCGNWRLLWFGHRGDRNALLLHRLLILSHGWWRSRYMLNWLLLDGWGPFLLVELNRLGQLALQSLVLQFHGECLDAL